MSKITTHAEQRLDERVTAKYKDKNNYVERAWIKGKTYHEVDNKSVKKILMMAEKERPDYIAKYFGERIFIFTTSKVLVTVEELPQIIHKCAIKHAPKRRYENYV